MKEIIDLLNEVKNEKLKKSLLDLYSDVGPKLKKLPAAIRWHHPEIGGLHRHVKEVMNIALQYYETMKTDLITLSGVTRDDVILVSFVHDTEKLDKYKFNVIYEPGRKYEKGYRETQFGYNFDKIDMNDTAQVVRMCARYGIFLSNTQTNAITFHHGGWSVDNKGKLTSLAALLHGADLMSATLYKNGG